MSDYSQENEQSIGSLVRKMESDFVNNKITVSRYVQESPWDDLNTIDAYLNSKHITGSVDSLNREKPFFNIVLAARNIWFRATDLDRKDIKLKATKSKDSVASFLAQVHLQEYMRRENFGQFLNTWGIYLASYNSAVVKFVEKDNRLYPMVMDWQKMIVDFIDFDSNPRIEILELTEAQLYQNPSYDKDMVEKLCMALASRTLTNKQQKDTKANYIKLYEVHGNLPLSYLTGNEADEDTYVQQMHVISFVASKQKGEFDDYTLYSGREKKDPYMLTYLLPSVNGSISLTGSVKSLFEAQWMKNHTVKAIKDQLDLASKLIFQTADTSFANKNALSAIESGDIMVHKENMPLSSVQNNSHDVGSLESFGQMWETLAREVTNTPTVLSGMASGAQSAYRKEALMIQQAQANFDVMTENKGLAVERMLREYIIPYLKKQMDTSKEISATLEAHDITQIDSLYVPNEAIRRFNKKAVEAVINKTQMPDLSQEQQQVMGELGQAGNQRYFKPSEISDKTWKDIFKDFEWEVEVDITGEESDKQLVLTTLNSIYHDIISVTGNPQDPNAKLVYNKILMATGAVSPIELSVQPPKQNAPSNKVGESLNYKDAPEDVKRQIEQQAGLKPSQIQNQAVVGAGK